MTFVRVHATNFDGSDHWQHDATLLRAENGLVVTSAPLGVEVLTERGPWSSPFETRGHYWNDRWFNVIRLETEGVLRGFYCNIASPVDFDGATVRYIDLQLDVRIAVTATGLTCTVVDEDEFEAASARYAYPPDLIANCRAAVQQVIALAEAREFPFDEA